ncbi:archease [Thermotoga sp. KOL6]|uniref:archease n=1 Tax=Thermotoga sp. KOL6 TaxID=126741 RepID=UPI000C77DE59|nr:archease [Thermotoga sp. KOL6]PLV59821.1 archease [Thermotoga sp. KOL6]
MRRPLEHTADIAYEISGESFLDLLQEVRNILLEVEGIEVNEEKKEKFYIFEETEDNFFDIVNDWIAEISKNWAPWRLEINGNRIKVVFRKIKRREGTEIKALTYHLLKFERGNGTLKTKVVFDI